MVLEVPSTSVYLSSLDAEVGFLWNYYQISGPKGRPEAVSLQAYVMHALCAEEFIITAG